MDHRIEDIFVSLLANIETLDNALISASRSELFVADEKCLGLVEHIREACMSTLHSVLAVERKLQGKSFAMPDEINVPLE